MDTGTSEKGSCFSSGNKRRHLRSLTPGGATALSNDSGKVSLDWEILEEDAGRKLRLIWTEAGGPPVSAPVQRGFGSRLIERSARDQLGGEATVDFLPRGVVYTLTVALQAES